MVEIHMASFRGLGLSLSNEEEATATLALAQEADRLGFDEDAQKRLAGVAAQLDTAGVHVILSNSWCPFICDLYSDRGFQVREVQATRNVNSRADRRGKIPEALISNF